MKRFNYGSTALWNTILLFAVIFAVFVLPVLSEGWHRTLFRSVYTLIYFSAILSLEKRKNPLIILLVSTFMIEWISGILNLSGLLILAKFVNILFFLVIVVSLIRQIATARKVSAGVILGSLAGYLLLGLGYGDIVVLLKPYTRSLATLIAVTGQFYIAIIVALLVGKFSAQNVNFSDE